MQDDQMTPEEFREATSPPSMPLPPGSQRRRRTTVAPVDTSPTINLDTAPIAEPQPHPNIVTQRAEYFVKLSEGSAKAMLAAEAGYRLAQQLQAIVNLYDPDQIDEQMRPHAQVNVDMLYEVASRLDQTVKLIADVVGSEWMIYANFYPMYRG